MKKIEFHTGNMDIDWLLSSEKTSIEDYAIGNVIRFLIQKHNDLVDEVTQIINSRES